MEWRKGLAWFVFSICAAISICALAIRAQVAAQTPAIQIEAYALPEKVRQGVGDLAAESDVLVLGEMHGTQEVPAVAVALLEPLAKLGYGALALEIPASEREALTNWALGKSKTIPRFFAEPWADGRANVQALALIRTALSPPYSWKLICFDMSEEDAAEFNKEADPKDAKGDVAADDGVAGFVQRDAMMAKHFAKQRTEFGDKTKVLAICGGMHARTSKGRTAGDAEKRAMEASMNKYWPCFAAALAVNHPEWQVRSVHVVPHGGSFFAVMSVEGKDEPLEGKVHPVRSKRRLAEAEAHASTDAPWNWELNLPRATPATFLATPKMPMESR